MSSVSDEDPGMSSARQPRLIGQLAQIEVEKPARKMTLMFGERQVVFIRSDGLRSRVVRENLKKSDKDMEEEKNRKEKEKRDSETLDEVIDYVARGHSEQSPPSSSIESMLSPSGSSSSSVSQNPECSTSVNETRSVYVPGTPNEPTSSTEDSSESNRKRRIVSGNRIYHPPKQYNGETTMVPHKKRWTYQTACNINAADQSNDSPMYYIPDPFLPMPRGRRNEISTADRMNYAAQRLDNRKFRGQVEAGNQIASNANERVTCEKCGMRYFFESKQMQERISYLPPLNEEDLPIVLFDCPVCKVQTKVFS